MFLVAYLPGVSALFSSELYREPWSLCFFMEVEVNLRRNICGSRCAAFTQSPCSGANNKRCVLTFQYISKYLASYYWSWNPASCMRWTHVNIYGKSHCKRLERKWWSAEHSGHLGEGGVFSKIDKILSLFSVTHWSLVTVTRDASYFYSCKQTKWSSTILYIHSGFPATLKPNLLFPYSKEALSSQCPE